MKCMLFKDAVICEDYLVLVTIEWVWTICGMIVTGENRTSLRKAWLVPLCTPATVALWSFASTLTTQQTVLWILRWTIETCFALLQPQFCEMLESVLSLCKLTVAMKPNEENFLNSWGLPYWPWTWIKRKMGRNLMQHCPLHSHWTKNMPLIQNMQHNMIHYHFSWSCVKGRYVTILVCSYFISTSLCISE